LELDQRSQPGNDRSRAANDHRRDDTEGQLIQEIRLQIIDTARRAGLLRTENGHIAGRIRETLPQTAKAQSGLTSDTEPLEYGLATVALEDNFGPKILARKGPVSEDIQLKF
jgi:hypothetical protein